jgi:ABC-type sugar transport system permease subunit
MPLPFQIFIFAISVLVLFIVAMKQHGLTSAILQVIGIIAIGIAWFINSDTALFIAIIINILASVILIIMDARSKDRS